MSQNYTISRLVAKLISGLGWLILVFWALLGLIGGWVTEGFFVGLLMGIAAGLFIGVPYIVFGELVACFLEKRDLLAELVQKP